MASAATGKVLTNKESGKDFLIMSIDGSPLLKVGFEGGGEVPKELSRTLFSSRRAAEKAIEAYKAKRG